MLCLTAEVPGGQLDLGPLGRRAGTHPPTQAAPSCLPTNKGLPGSAVREAGPPGTSGSGILGARHECILGTHITPIFQRS